MIRRNKLILKMKMIITRQSPWCFKPNFLMWCTLSSSNGIKKKLNCLHKYICFIYSIYVESIRRNHNLYFFVEIIIVSQKESQTLIYPIIMPKCDISSNSVFKHIRI